VAVLAVAPAAASAAEVTVPECVRSVSGQQTLTVAGSGFTPDQLVTVQANGETVGTALANATGAVSASFLPPALSSPNRNVQTFQLTATDAAGVAAGPVAFKVTRITVDLPDRAHPRSRVLYKVYGFAPDRNVYLHIRRGGRTRGSYKIGKAAGACGMTSRRLRYMPLRSYRTGVYDYFFQQSRRYASAQPYLQVQVSIVRVPR
jgi:hypothetical protein